MLSRTTSTDAKCSNTDFDLFFAAMLNSECWLLLPIKAYTDRDRGAQGTIAATTLRSLGEGQLRVESRDEARLERASFRHSNIKGRKLIPQGGPLGSILTDM